MLWEVIFGKVHHNFTTLIRIINAVNFMTNSLDVISTISAKDVDTGVVGYFISENPMTPSATLPGWIEVEPEVSFGATIPFTLSPGDGTKTVYVWFKDLGNNIPGTLQLCARKTKSPGSQGNIDVGQQ